MLTRNLTYLSGAGVLIVIDQLSKWLVRDSLSYGEEVVVTSFFSWVRWHNEGAAFSMLDGADARWFFVALAIGFSAFILFELRRLPAHDRMMRLVFALILGGALGNMIDRLFLGYVVDFVLVHYADVWYFPAFNVADSALSIGATLWIGTMAVEYFQTRRDKHSPAEPR